MNKDFVNTERKKNNRIKMYESIVCMKDSMKLLSSGNGEIIPI